MKRKKATLIGLFVLGLMTWNLQAENFKMSPEYNSVNSIPHGYDDIVLRGDLATSTGPNAIEAGASNDAVYIGFNQDFGNVNISIYNNDMGGLVYSTVVNTAVQPVVIIPFQNEANGTYTLELSNAIGYAEGEFDHE